MPVQGDAENARGFGGFRMTCDEARKNLPLFLYGELSFDEEELVEVHVDECAACRQELAREKAMFAALDGVELVPSPDALAESRAELRRRIALAASGSRTTHAHGSNFWDKIREGFTIHFHFAPGLAQVAQPQTDGERIGIFVEQLATATQQKIQPAEASVGLQVADAMLTLGEMKAHLLRDARYAVECGDTAFSAPFRLLLLRAVAIGRRRETLKDTTLKQYLYDLDRRLDRILAVVPIGEPGRKLHKRMLANRAHLFVFMSNRAVPCTNNISERHLRPSVIFRKVTNGFRCEWGAETYAAFRSVVSTAKANGASVLDTVRFVISAKRPSDTLAGAG